MQPETSVREQLALRPAVQRIADDRQRDAREMNANLMTAASLRHDRDQREIADAADRLDGRARGTAGAFGISAGRIADHHLARILRMMCDWRLDRNFAIEITGDQCLVTARDFRRSDRVAQLDEGATISRDQ